VQREILVSSRRRWAAVLAMSAVFVLIGLQTGFWPASVFFGLCALVAIGILVRPSRLVLERDGFVATTLGRTFHYRWSDIARFGVTTLPVGNQKMVGLVFSAGYPRSKGTGLSQALSGFDGALPDTYGRKAEDLVVVLEAWRRRALEGQ
jgi:hypothetical protein